MKSIDVSKSKKRWMMMMKMKMKKRVGSVRPALKLLLLRVQLRIVSKMIKQAR